MLSSVNFLLPKSDVSLSVWNCATQTSLLLDTLSLRFCHVTWTQDVDVCRIRSMQRSRRVRRPFVQVRHHSKKDREVHCNHVTRPCCKVVSVHVRLINHAECDHTQLDAFVQLFIVTSGNYRRLNHFWDVFYSWIKFTSCWSRTCFPQWGLHTLRIFDFITIIFNSEGSSCVSFSFVFNATDPNTRILEPRTL